MSGQRLDKYLADKQKDFSRNAYQKIIRDFGVRVNGRLIKKPHAIIKEGDDVQLSDELLRQMQRLSAPKFGLKSDFSFDSSKIIFDGGSFVVIDKPPGIRTEDVSASAACRLFAVHRLDKDTSGVLVLAKDRVALAALQKQWRERLVQKTYVALVKGRLTPRRGAIEGGISRSFHDRKKMALSASLRAREAYTEYEVVRYCEEMQCTLVHLFPATGRTHQIRVHLAGIGHPIVGDTTYGDLKLNEEMKEKRGLTRQFLHAEKLELTDPNTKKRISFESKLPEDLAHVIAKH